MVNCLKRILLPLCLLFYSAISVSAHGNEDPCSSFKIKLEGIYFQPFFNNDFVSVPNLNGPNPFNLQPGGPGKKNKFNYTPGWRLTAGYVNSCIYIQNINLRFTGLSASHVKNIDLAEFFSSDFASGSVHSKHRCNYYASDLWTDMCMVHNESLHFGIQPGLHYAVMNYQSHVHYSIHRVSQTSEIPLTPSGNLSEKSYTWGLGPQLGLKLDWQVCESITLQGRVAGGILVSRAKVRFDIDSFNANNPKTSWKVFPFWETTLSLSSWISIYDHLVELTLGYEYLSYPNFINRVQFPSNGSSSQPDNLYSTFDFQGPYISVAYHF